MNSTNDNSNSNSNTNPNDLPSPPPLQQLLQQQEQVDARSLTNMSHSTCTSSSTTESMRAATEFLSGAVTSTTHTTTTTAADQEYYPTTRQQQQQQQQLPSNTPWTLGSTDGSYAEQLLAQLQLQLQAPSVVSPATPTLATTPTMGNTTADTTFTANTTTADTSTAGIHWDTARGVAIRTGTGTAMAATPASTNTPNTPNTTTTATTSTTASTSLVLLQDAIANKRSIYQERLFRQPCASVEACLAASCEVMGFDIAEMWLRTGPKTHQLTNSHLRPAALDASVRDALVEVYYGEKSAERTHRLSPALCKRAKEAEDVIWVTEQTRQGADALRYSISQVRTAVAVPVCHDASNTNITIIFFSVRRCVWCGCGCVGGIRPWVGAFLGNQVWVCLTLSFFSFVLSCCRVGWPGVLASPFCWSCVLARTPAFCVVCFIYRVIVKPTSVEFLVHMSLAAGVSSINSLAEVGLHLTPPHSAAANFTRSEHLPSNGSSIAIRHQRVDQTSVTGARLDLQWRQLHNVEYLTDGGNSWIHTAVFHGKAVVVKTLKPECQDVALAINEIEGELAVHSRLNHPNIVNLLGAGMTSRGVRFVVLERLDGGTLSQRLGYDTRIRDRRRRFWRRKTFSFVDVLRVARSIADAMAYCHESAIPGSVVLHRDLKPDNIGACLCYVVCSCVCVCVCVLG
jgi:hypothetical protein